MIITIFSQFIILSHLYGSVAFSDLWSEVKNYTSSSEFFVNSIEEIICLNVCNPVAYVCLFIYFVCIYMYIL